jgi:copper(I)-binding protein
MSFRKTVAAGLVALTLSAVAIAQAEQIGQLSISQPWTRATPPKAQTAGGFLTIENAGASSDRLVGASSPIASRTEIHEMRMDDGVMVMRPAADGITIPAGGSVTLAPGGFHIMFMQLKNGLAEGDAVPVELNFERAGDIEVLFPVESIGAAGPATAPQNGAGMHSMPGHGHGQSQ